MGDPGEVERVIKRMIDALLVKVRAYGKRVRTMTIKVRYPDFAQGSHGRSLPEAAEVEAPFYPLVRPLLRAAWRQSRPLQLVSVRFSNVEDKPAQLGLFADGDDKRRRLAEAMDRLNLGGKAGVVRHGHQLKRRGSEAK